MPSRRRGSKDWSRSVATAATNPVSGRAPGMKMRDQPRPGVRHRRLHDRHEDVRRAGLRLLRGRPADVRARTRNGFTPACAQQLFKKFRGARNHRLSVRQSARGEERPMGTGLTKAKMADCRWLKPVLVGQFEFLEWTADNHLRHTKFVALREDKPARRAFGAEESIRTRPVPRSKRWAADKDRRAAGSASVSRRVAGTDTNSHTTLAARRHERRGNDHGQDHDSRRALRTVHIVPLRTGTFAARAPRRRDRRRR